VKPQKNTFSSIASGKASAPGRALRRETVPIEEVGQATRAMSALRSASGLPGCSQT
jgi:hypothetical protein